MAAHLDKTIENVLDAKKINDINNLKKLQGFKEYYRIRIGAYRIGVKIIDDTVIFSVFDHRKDIYKRFP
jgi:mRNA interferase RelE/StbE